MRGTDFYGLLSSEGSFRDLDPGVAAFLREYLLHEKVKRFGEQYVINTHFPPWPSPAFDRFADRLSAENGDRLYSVTIAVTNRCPFTCWHCYNADRSPVDVPFPVLERLADDLAAAGAVMVTLTGGEPMLRPDLAEIVGLFDERFTTVLGTTGWELTPERVGEFADRGLFGVGISLDSTVEGEHDRMRGREGAFAMALDGLRVTRSAGLYPYLVSVGTREFLVRERFDAFLRFAAEAGAEEVHLLEPFTTGRLAGRSDVLLTPADRARIVSYQKEVAVDDSLPVLSSFAYIESPETFGCGAGISHLYIDGSGDVYPCQQVPHSFGNLARMRLEKIMDRMAGTFRNPRANCVASCFYGRDPSTDPEVSEHVCTQCLPDEHELPEYAKVLARSPGTVGTEDVRVAYEEVGRVYDEYWVTEAGGPVVELIEELPLDGVSRVFEAGCGTGFGTEKLLAAMPTGVEYRAVDLSGEMLSVARRRVPEGVEFVEGDALAALEEVHDLDLIFTSWVLGYIPLAPFFRVAFEALAPGGRLAFLVHRQDSPREPIEIFESLVAEDPSVLTKRVWFDFPRDLDHADSELRAAGFEVTWTRADAAVFTYDTAVEVLTHLRKSGAGTTFYHALDPTRRPALEERFLAELASRHDGPIPVIHDYVAAIATRPG